MPRPHLPTLLAAALVAAALVAACATSDAPRPSERAPEYALTGAEELPYAEQNHAYRWMDVMQEACARDVERIGARPTVLSHQMMLWGVAMFDAWACYDDVAIGSVFGGDLRRPESERTLANKQTAIAHASFTALVGALPEHEPFLRDEMRRLGFDPDDRSLDTTTPVGIGNVCAWAVLEARAHDGANMLGDDPRGDGTPYSDTTGYEPVNTVDTIVDPDRWQPITFTRPDGTRFTPGFLTPQFADVTPFVLESPDQFRAPPPPTTRTDDAELRRQTAEVLRMNAELTDEEKALVEFMRDGPRSTGQSGHWLRFAQDVSRRSGHDLDTDVKLFFAIAVTAHDAFVSCWDTKRFYDSSRPWTLVRHYYAGQTVRGWAGPQGGVVEMPAEEWHPYSPYEFITPPFPGYTSGHATVSGACAKVLELFTGTDEYGATEVRPCCALTEHESHATARLELPTYSATSAMAARSRALGGYHIPIDNDEGLRLGRELAEWAWPRIRSHWDAAAGVDG